MNEQKSKKNITLSFKITEELNKKIETLATKSNRTKSNFVITLLTKGINDIDNNIMQ